MSETLLIADNNNLAREVHEAAFVQAGYRVLSATNGLEALERAQRENPDLVILDIALPMMDGIEVCSRLRQDPRTASQLLVIHSRRDALEDKLAAFRAGADDYLVKPMDPRELVARVGAMLARARRGQLETPPKETSKLITFLSAKGGVGTTSVCVNTAAALACRSQGRVVVVDLVLPMGSASYMAGLHAKATLAQLCRNEAGAITRSRVEDHLVSRDGLGFSLLVGAWGPKEALEVSPDHIGPLLQLLKEVATYTLVDAGRTLSRISLPAITASDRIVVVLSPDSSSVLMTKTWLAFLQELEVPRDRLVLVLSLPVGWMGMSKQEAEDHLETSIFGVIPYESDRFTVAASLGIPLVQKEPGCAATQQFMELARHLMSNGR